MATHFSVLAWRIPGTGEPGGLPSMGSHRVGHDWSGLAAAAATVERLGMALSPPSRTKRSQSSPRESRGSWSWQLLASKVSASMCGGILQWGQGVGEKAIIKGQWGGLFKRNPILWNKKRKEKINSFLYFPLHLNVTSLMTQSIWWKIRIWSWHSRIPSVRG